MIRAWPGMADGNFGTLVQPAFLLYSLLFPLWSAFPFFFTIIRIHIIIIVGCAAIPEEADGTAETQSLLVSQRTSGIRSEPE